MRPFLQNPKNSRHLRQLKRRGGWNVKIWAQCKHGANSRNITTNIWQKIMPWHICKLDSGSTLFLFVNRHISSHSVTSRTDTLKRKAKMLSRGAWGLQDLARWRKCKRGACPALGYFGSLTNSNEHKFAFILKVYCKNKLKWVFIALKKIRSAITVYCILFQFQASQISIGHDLLLQVVCKDSNVWWGEIVYY